jgi:hypothetical protein
MRHRYDSDLGADDGCWQLTGLDEHRGVACHAVVQVDGATGAVERRLVAPWPLDPNATSFSESITHYSRNFMSVAVADLDGDGEVEIIGGPAVWNLDGSLRWSVPVQAADTAVADLDGDGTAEVAMLTNTPGSDTRAIRQLRVHAHDGQPRWSFAFGDAQSGAGGQLWTRLALADTDGDGVAEVLVLAGSSLFVFDGNGRIRWARTFRVDPLTSSLFTYHGHAQVYDLDNDGQPEVVLYNGDHLWVLAGADGRVRARWAIERAPATAYPQLWQRHNTPQIADVDGDGHVDILLLMTETATNVVDPSAMVISGAANDWAPAPRIWNQHAYRGTTVDDDGTILFDGTVPRSFRQQRRLAPPVPRPDPDAVTIPYVADDGSDASAPADIVIDLRRANRPPQITSPRPPATWAPNTNFDWTFSATDPDPGDSLSWTLDGGCVGAWTPGAQTARLIYFSTQDDCFGIVTVTDSQGASASQVFRARQSSATAAVPDVVGQPVSAAEAGLVAAGMGLGEIQRLHAPQAAGTVIAQAPAAGLIRPIGTWVDLTASLGPEPVAVPNLVGRAEPAALAELGSLGLATTVSRVLSTSAPAGAVLAQTPAPGTEIVPLPANLVTLTVSAGSGLRLALDRSAVAAGSAIAVTVVARNADGTPAPAPALTWAIAPRYTPTIGAMPSYAAGTITVPASARGTYRITALDSAGGRSASIDFAVLAPAEPGIDGATAEHAKLLQVLDGIAAIGRQMEA